MEGKNMAENATVPSSNRPASSTNNGVGQDASTDLKKKDQYLKRDHSREREWGKDKYSVKRAKENGNDDSKSNLKPNVSAAPPQTNATHVTTAPFTNFGYGSDQMNMDAQKRGYMMPSYGMFSGISPQWGVSNMEMQQNKLLSPNMPTVSMANGMDMPPSTSTAMNPYSFMGMPADPMFMMNQMPPPYLAFPMNQEGMMIPAPTPVREPITLSKSTLYPPGPNAKTPTRRQKPPLCKTVYVGGLPKKATDEIMREVFAQYGEILTIRMNEKHFCHIRFAAEEFVENAMVLSGWRIKIENKDDSEFTGRLHVDYATAKDDEYEYECLLRQKEREARHQIEYRPPTPPAIPHYSDNEATALGEKLRNEDTFKDALHTLVTWLERGECSKRNAGYFYSMVQSTNSHVRRLMLEKTKAEEELNKAKLMLQQKMAGIALQFNEIDKVFEAAYVQKVWDHFSKSQRKNIEMWKKQTQEIKIAHSEELVGDRIEDEMELSDGEGESSSESRLKKSAEEITSLQQINETLVHEMEEVRKMSEEKIVSIRDRFQSAQHKNLDLQKEVDRLTVSLRDRERHEPSHSQAESAAPAPSVVVRHDTSGGVSVTESEARLVALISTFLNVHPFGASIDYICSYLYMVDPCANARDVESLMRRFPGIFKEVSSGIGANLQKKWTFLAFQQ